MINFNHPNFADKVACIVENDLILESLYKQLNNLLNVQVKNQSRLESCKLRKDGAKKSEVTLKSGEQFSCDLLVS
jgi:2-polyprenyl-6-methoxyphenol hydroxylase-like FAD-dependent oxidoreductase